VGTPTTAPIDRLRVGWLNGRGTARAEDAQGTPTQSHISPSILVYEDYSQAGFRQQEQLEDGNRPGTNMCSGSEAGSYLRLIDFVYRSTLGLRVKKMQKKIRCGGPPALRVGPNPGLELRRFLVWQRQIRLCHPRNQKPELVDLVQG